MRHTIKCFVIAAALAVCSSAFAETIDNAEYAQWSKYKPGTFVTMKQSIDLGGAGAAAAGMPPGMDMSAMMPQTSMTTKLTDVKPDALTLEITTNTTQMGNTRSNTTTRTVPAKVERPTTMPATAPGTRPTVDMKDVKEGKDTLEVNGKKIETTTLEYTGTSPMPAGAGMGIGGRGRAGRAGPGADDAAAGGQMDAHIKIWRSAEIPGGQAKMESSTTMQGMGDIKTSMTVTDFSIVK